MAPGAKVRVYVVRTLDDLDLGAAYDQILSDAPIYGIHQMTMSYGLGENETPTSSMDADHAVFVDLANAGVTCFASTGDEGSTPGYDPNTGLQNENGQLEVDYPASDPDVTGVGGTTLILAANNSVTSETVWNSTLDGVAGASGGGTSLTSSGFSFPRPSWQTGTGVPSGSARLVPDISCAADPNYAGDVYYTDPVLGVEEALGGTSWASPTNAGFCALLNQALANLNQSPLGLLGPHIYPLIGTTSFRDITSGNNATANSGGLYVAGTGYDEATGIGVPLVQTLAKTLAGTQNLVGVVPQAAFVTVNQGETATIAVTATGSPTSYQWQRNPLGANPPQWTNLSDNATYSGSSTATLTVTGTTPAMSGDQFQCVVTYAGNVTATSNPPTGLIVETPWLTSTLAGKTGTASLVNATGSAAEFDYPTGIAIDSSGNLYVADDDNNVIRKVTPGGAVTTPYGTYSGTTGTSGFVNGSTGNTSSFYAPRAITIDGSNNLYVSDEGNNAIRKINTSTQTSPVSTVTTITANTPSLKGIGIVKSTGVIYVADYGNNVIWKVANGAATVFAGSTSFASGYANESGTDPTQALFNGPIGLAVDQSTGNVYVADYGNCVVRKIVPGGAVTTVAGQAGIAGFVDGAGNQALFNLPRELTIDGSGNLYVTDCATPILTTPEYSGNSVLRMISPAGVVTTLAGQAGITGNSDGEGNQAQFYNLAGLAMNGSGEIFLAEAGNNTIRTVTVLDPISVTATSPNAAVVGGTSGQFTVTRTGSTSSSQTVTYSLSGTAANGTDYVTLPGTVTIPAGASSATITVTPSLDSQASGNLTAILTLTGGGLLTNPISATVTIAEMPSSDLVNFSTWESNHSISGPPTEITGYDGIPLLLKYLYDINPSVPMGDLDYGATPFAGVTTIGENQYLTLTYRRYLYATGVTVNVQTSTDMQSWTTVNLNPPNPANSFSQQIGWDTTKNPPDPIMEVGVQITNPAGQFLRLNVTSP